METSQLVEIEPYEEIVGTFGSSTPRIGQSYSSENARVQLTSQEPMPVFSGTEAIPATMPFAPIPRSTVRYNELAGTDEPQTVGVTMSPERGARIVRLSDSDGHEYVGPEMAVQTDLFASVDQAMMPDEDRISTDSSHDDPPRSASRSWMSVITTRLDALWNAFHGRPKKEPEESSI